MKENRDFNFDGKRQEKIVAALMDDPDMKRILGDLKEILEGTIDSAIDDASIEYERESGHIFSDMYPKEVIDDYKREIAIRWFNGVLDTIGWASDETVLEVLNPSYKKQKDNNLNDITKSNVNLAFTRKQLQMAEWSRKFNRLFDMPLECFIDKVAYKARLPWFDLTKFEDNLVAEEEWDEDQYSTAEIVEMRYGKEARQLIEELIDAK